MFWRYLPAGLLWLKETVVENEIPLKLFEHLHVLQGRHMYKYEKGIWG